MLLPIHPRFPRSFQLTWENKKRHSLREAKPYPSPVRSLPCAAKTTRRAFILPQAAPRVNGGVSAPSRTPGDVAKLRKAAREALEAVENYDADTGLEVIALLRAYDYGTEINDLIDGAAAALKKYEYDDAVELLWKVLS
jgi:hypothetical protein